MTHTIGPADKLSLIAGDINYAKIIMQNEE
jgi:hypothetical protein